VLEGGHGPTAADEIVLHRDRKGAITGAVYFGTQLVIAADTNEAVDAFAVEARRHPGVRSFVGSRVRVDRLWENVCSWHRPPVLVRARQPVYVLLPASLAPTPPLDVRPATLAEAEVVIENSAEMMLGELGYDPRTDRVGFGAGVRHAIGLGQWWVYIDGGGLKFQLNVGARSSATAQLQGVWTPPQFRKRGNAFNALGQIAQHLLSANPTLSLYVNDFNRDAIALYERLGFVCVGEMSTLLFA
jgi:ribosomal protein S18 acetylase RimI-like enzyme